MNEQTSTPGHQAIPSTTHGSLADSLPGTMPPLPSEGEPSLPDYELLGELGRGGMGVVYRARHVSLDRVVALKMIRADRGAEPAYVARFLNEARAAARLAPPNVGQVHAVGEHQGRPFLALEYVDGPTLERACQHRPQPPQQAARLVEQMARAVQAAHDEGIVHRDLKPANVLLQGPTVRE